MRIIMIMLVLSLSTAAIAQDCVIGNTQGVTSFTTGWIEEAALYGQLTDPMATTCSCDPGFAVHEVRIFLVMDVGATVRLQAGLYEADDVGGCKVPGLSFATSDPMDFDGITAAGLYEFVIPCDFICAVMNDTYFLGVDVLAYTGSVELPFTGSTTGVPKARSPGDLCTSYRDVGAGWVDMIEAGLGGGMPISAAVTCCGDPIPRDTGTWGYIKRMYR